LWPYDETVLGPGDVISYLDMCREEGVNLQRGMNYRLRDNSRRFIDERPAWRSVR
jgi:hypothetical protein